MLLYRFAMFFIEFCDFGLQRHRFVGHILHVALVLFFILQQCLQCCDDLGCRQTSCRSLITPSTAATPGMQWGVELFNQYSDLVKLVYNRGQRRRCANRTGCRHSGGGIGRWYDACGKHTRHKDTETQK